VTTPEKHDGSLLHFAGDVLGTALDAADKIMHSLGAGVIPIAVPIPPTISTLNFDVTPREALHRL
jgi:hypothetical protein